MKAVLGILGEAKMTVQCYECHLDVFTCDVECDNKNFISLKEDSIIPKPAANKSPPEPVEVTIIINDEAEKIIDESLPDIIKERMKEENTKIRIRNKRKSIREMLRR